ncbi:hypothetical protein JW998_03900 [candidate division KSB1 bacterium]|nr:hypothetical protein [candidate division KSB1 bacterium]
MKKSWQKPQLTVLLRTRPQEAILGQCKNSSAPGGQNSANSQCYKTITGKTCHGVCRTVEDS